MEFAPSIRGVCVIAPDESLLTKQVAEHSVSGPADKESIDRLSTKEATFGKACQRWVPSDRLLEIDPLSGGSGNDGCKTPNARLQPEQEPSPTYQPCQQPLREPSPLHVPQAGTSFHLCPDPEFSLLLPEQAQVKTPDCLLKTNFSSSRFRKSCYFDATLRWGVKSFIPYNHMLLPTCFTSAEQEYTNLRANVCLWDVACERQIEICGPDALQLAELLTPRSLKTMNVGECRYAMMTDNEGHVINDPVVLKVADDRFWFSIADSDMLFWVKGLALGRGLDVRVAEAAVSPLAVQGPKSTDLMRDLFGDWVSELKFYHFRETKLNGIPMLLARSGWSPERGYELYLQDESRGDELWELVMAAGRKYSIAPGCANHMRRMEGSLLGYGSDITSSHSVLELGLPPKWCQGDKAADFIGKTAIQSLMKSGGPQRRIVGLKFQDLQKGEELGPLVKPWAVLAAEQGAVVGQVSSACFSPALRAHIAIATVALAASNPGNKVYVETLTGSHHALVCETPFMPRAG